MKEGLEDGRLKRESGKGVIRLRDIAEKLNISASTVSRALAGNLNISAETRDAVQRAAVQMQYASPLHGARKHSAATRTVGVLIDAEDLNDRSMIQLLQNIHGDMQEVGYQVVTILDSMNSGSDGGRLSTFRPLVDSYLDGIILCSATADSFVLRELRRLGIPVVLAARSAESVQTDTVQADDAWGGWQLAQHLYTLGHRRIGLIMGRQETSTSRDRVRGFVDYMSGIEACGESVKIAWNATRFDDGYARALEMLSEPNRVTAIVGAGDPIVLGTLEAARTKRIAVPDDLSIAGFGDVALYGCRLKGLTIISSPMKEMSRKVCQRIIERIRTGGLAPPAHDVIPTRLVQRTTSVPPLRSEQWRKAAL